MGRADRQGDLFDDLFSERGRASVPPSVVATVMVPQRLDGLSDREAVDRYAFDVRWSYAAPAGGAPANYLDIGGGASPERVLTAFRAVLRDDDVRAILINIFAASTAATGWPKAW